MAENQYTISPAGLRLIQSFEGFRNTAYLDGNGIPTIGWGHTAGVKVGDTCTLVQANEWLLEDAAEAERCVLRVVDVNLLQKEFDALVSFTYNLGCGRLQSSTLLRLLNLGDIVGAANQFLVWNRIGGKVSPGLDRRRIAERQMFLNGTPGGA